MLAFCQQIEVHLIQGHQNMFLLVYKHVFPYQRVEDTSNETDSLNIHDQNSFTEDQPILS